MRSTIGGTEPWQAVQSAAEGLAADDVASWSDEQVRGGLLALLSVVNQLNAVVSTVSGSFDRRGLADGDGFRTARSWLTAYGRMSQGAATGWLSRGRLLRQLPALSAAAHTGAVSAEHVRTVGDLVGHVGIENVEPFDEVLATLAATTNKHPDVEAACQRIRAHVDPDGPDPDPDAGERRALSIARYGSLFSVSGRLDAEGGATLLTALDALMRPPTPDDNRTGVQRRADAVVELARRALEGGALPLVGGVRPQLGLLITPEALLGLRKATGTAPADEAAASAAAVGAMAAVGPAIDRASADCASTGNLPERQPDAFECAGVPMAPELPWSTWADRLPASVAQKLACDCEVWRIILGRPVGFHWRSGGHTGSCHLGSARRCMPGIGAAGGPDAQPRRTGPRSITWSPGTSAACLMWTILCFVPMASRFGARWTPRRPTLADFPRSDDG